MKPGIPCECQSRDQPGFKDEAEYWKFWAQVHAQNILTLTNDPYNHIGGVVLWKFRHEAQVTTDSDPDLKRQPYRDCVIRCPLCK